MGPFFAVDAWGVIVDEDFQVVSVDGPVAVGIAWHGGDQAEEFAAGFVGAEFSDVEAPLGVLAEGTNAVDGAAVGGFES